MPIYEYRCQKCERVFEYMQRMSEDPKTLCEECGGALERLISQSAFHLKGGGWYKDLYSSTKKDDGKKSDTVSTAVKSDSASSGSTPSSTPSTSTGSSSGGSSSGGSSSGGSSSGGSSSGGSKE